MRELLLLMFLLNAYKVGAVSDCHDCLLCSSVPVGRLRIDSLQESPGKPNYSFLQHHFFEVKDCDHEKLLNDFEM